MCEEAPAYMNKSKENKEMKAELQMEAVSGDGGWEERALEGAHEDLGRDRN